MWTCVHCQEQSPDTFSSCWRCEKPKEAPAAAVVETAPIPVAEPPIAEPLEEPEPIAEGPQATPKPIRRPAPAPAPRRGPRWEYRWVTFEATDAEDADYQVYRASSIDQDEVPGWEEKGPLLEEYCEQAGSEGWEMIAQSFDEDGTLWVSFKRLRT